MSYFFCNTRIDVPCSPPAYEYAYVFSDFYGFLVCCHIRHRQMVFLLLYFCSEEANSDPPL